MDIKEILKFFKYVIGVIATIVVIHIITQSGFMLTTVKVDYKDFTIEVTGNEKNTQPDQE